MGGRRVLAVTGAAGFVGRRIVHRALQEGWTVIALARSRDALGDLNHERLNRAEWRIGDPLPGTVDAVCHAAAFIPNDYADPSFAEECFRTNALGALQAFEAALAAQAKSFVLLSSGQIYKRMGRLVREDDAAYPTDRAVYYLASKLSAELFVQHRQSIGGMPAAVLRPSSVYGPGMRGGVVMRFAEAAASGSPLRVQDGGVYKADYVHVDDVAAAALAAVERKAQGVFNIGSGAATSTLELAQAIVAAVRADPALIEVAPAVSGGEGFDGLDVEKAKRLLGFKPRPVAEGMRDWLSAPLTPG